MARRLHFLPDGCKKGIINSLHKRCKYFNDPDRASRLLLTSVVSKRVFIGAPERCMNGKDVLSTGQNLVTKSQGAFLTPRYPTVEDSCSMATLAETAQILVIQSIAPGRSSYSIFVEALPESESVDKGPSNSTTEPHNTGRDTQDAHQDHLHHQQRLFLAALSGILDLPQPPGPGRLAFSAIPAYAAPAMLCMLREAGHDRLWDEPCYRYSLPVADLSPDCPADGSEKVAGRLSADPAPQAAAAAAAGPAVPPLYVLDCLRAEADVELVDAHWAYRSPYSQPLIRQLIANSHTVCVRLPSSQASSKSAAGGGAEAAADEGVDGDSLSDGAAATSDSSGGGGRHSNANSQSEQSPPSSLGSDAVAWILQYGDGSVGMAHTLASHRRKGLMRACVAALLRRVQCGEGVGGRGGGGGGGGGCETGAEEQHQEEHPQKDVFAFIVKENAASVALFESLGFQRCSGAYHWFGVADERESE